MGYQIVGAMTRAQARGVKLTCAVTGMAASMAFQILTHCDYRYALPSSLLLWHPVRVIVGGFFGTPITPALAYSLYTDLKVIEDLMLPQIERSLGMKRSTMLHHYHAETLWHAASLEKVAPNFLMVVEDIKGTSVRLWTKDSDSDSLLPDSTTPYFDGTYYYDQAHRL